jgi:hypothetical protein
MQMSLAELESYSPSVGSGLAEKEPEKTDWELSRQQL